MWHLCQFVGMNLSGHNAILVDMNIGYHGAVLCCHLATFVGMIIGRHVSVLSGQHEVVIHDDHATLFGMSLGQTVWLCPMWRPPF